jgi:hypothetical protein
MKTTIEVNGYEIVIQETDGMISVAAMKDGEMMEEFELQAGDETSDEIESDDEEMKDFGDFGSDEDEEEDFESQDEEEEDENEESEEDDDDEESDDMEESGEMEEGETKLESFQSFLKRRKK